jgi:predicted RNA-binding protein with PUA-like domain
MKYWLIKSEPEGYSIDDLKRDGKTAWEGVRNFAARNHMRDMTKGDLILFYHSSTKPMGVVGIAEVSAEAHPDESQFKKGDYTEPKATLEKPIWYCVDVAFVEKFPDIVTLEAIKRDEALEGMVLRTTSRLSVQPVSQKQFEHIRRLASS